MHRVVYIFISVQLGVLEQTFLISFFHLSSTLSHLHPLQVKTCDINLRLVVDGDYNGNFAVLIYRFLHSKRIYAHLKFSMRGSILDVRI